MKRHLPLGLVVSAALLVLPAASQAATLTNAAGTLTYTADAGATNVVGFAEVGPPSTTVDVYRFLMTPDGPPDVDPITSMPATCMEDQDTAAFITYQCTGVTKVVANTGDGNDQIDAGNASEQGTLLTTIEIEVDLGEGDDFSAGGQGDDILRGGDGNDVLFLDGFGESPAAGAGNDTGVGGAGNDGVFGGRGNDTVDLGAGNDHAGGGPGNDQLEGGPGDDDLGAGPGNDVLEGDSGNDTLTGECPGPCGGASAPAGADDVNGGDGFDLFTYNTFAPDDPNSTADPVTITLDDVANDGVSGELDDIDNDVEDVKVTGPGKATLTGAAGIINTLTTGDGDDTINSRDAHPDRVACGVGTDVANADTLDIVASDCETVNRVDSGNAFEDKAPTVAFTAPASNAQLSTSGANTLTATASDDKAVARVVFLDDERTVCSDTTAPYTCDYRPQGDDVGRNTLVAIAIDSSGQTASAVRAVRVPRFAGSLTATTSPKRDTTAPYRFTTTGRLRLPTSVTEAQGCKGTVLVSIKAGNKTVSTRRAKLSRSCTYRSRVTFRLPRRLNPRTLKVVVRFAGNEVVLPRSARQQTLRVRS